MGDGGLGKSVPVDVSEVARELADLRRRLAEHTSELAVEGEPCPVCGKRVGLSTATRSRRWRERRKEVE